MLYDADGILRLEVPGMAGLLMSELEFDGVDQLGEFLEVLADLELIDATAYHERNHVINTGVVREIDYYRAKSEAGKAGMKKRWGGKTCDA